MKRPALQNKQVAVLRMVFGPEKFSGLSRNGPLARIFVAILNTAEVVQKKKCKGH